MKGQIQRVYIMLGVNEINQIKELRQHFIFLTPAIL